MPLNEKNIEKKYISPSSSEKELNEKMSPFKNENFDKNDQEKPMSLSDKNEIDNKEMSLSSSSLGHNENGSENDGENESDNESSNDKTVHTLVNEFGNPPSNFNDLDVLNQVNRNENVNNCNEEDNNKPKDYSFINSNKI